jgi:hypothetical protein
LKKVVLPNRLTPEGAGKMKGKSNFTSDSLDEMVERSEAFVKSTLEEGKSLGPHLYIHLRNTLLVLPYKDPDYRKEIFLKQLAIAQILIARKAGTFLGASSSSEAWVSMGKNAMTLHSVMKPSQDPDRIESVLLQVWGSDGKAVFRGYELLREGSKKKLGKLLMTNENNSFTIKSWIDPAFRIIRPEN